MIWTAAVGGETCGGCDMPFRQHEPMALLTAKQLRRCQQCVAPTPVDWAAVEAVLAAREADQAAAAVNATTAFKGGAPVLPGFVSTADAPPPPRSPKLPAPKTPLPFAKVADMLPASTDLD